MVTTAVEKMANSIGFDIGNGADTAQIDLLNGLGEGFAYIKNHHDYDLQCCYVTKGLSNEAKRLIKTLQELIE